jgi:NCS1 family nucleobase:cation symporter-1
MFFILLPIWLFTTVVYCSFSSIMGAKEIYPEAAVAEQFELARKASELAYLNSTSNVIKDSKNNLPALARIAKYIAWAALACCAFMGVMSYVNHNMETIRTWLIAPTLVYFLTATYAYLAQNTANEIPVKSTINNAV